MTKVLLLTIGAVALLGAWRALDPERSAGMVTWKWGALISLLGLFHIVLGSDSLARYHVTLLGLRYRVLDGGVVGSSEKMLGGDYDSTHLNVRGSTTRTAAFLRAVGDSAVRAILVSVPVRPEAVALVRQQGARDWRVVGDRVFLQGDRVTVRLAGGAFDLRTTTLAAPESELFRWRSDDAIEGPAPDSAGNPTVVRLEPVTRSWRDRLRGGRRAGVFERAYPLADVLASLLDTAGTPIPPLASFFYYSGGQLHFADLDAEVELRGTAAVDTVWSAAGTRSLMLAGLPYRDFVAPDDPPPPVRGGVVPMMVMRATVNGPWLDVTTSAPEVVSLDRRTLCALDGRGRCDAGSPYRVRFSGVRHTVLRNAVAFELPPRRFEAASQAVFELPHDPGSGVVSVLTPRGRSLVEPGQPFGLGDNELQEILRVDGKRASLLTIAAFALLLALPIVALWLAPPNPVVRALALPTLGLAVMRLLLGLGAAVDFPFVAKALQTSAWVVVAMPWFVVALGSARFESAFPRWVAIVHAGYAAVTMGLAWVLFPDSLPTAVVFSLMALGVGTFRTAVAFPAGRRSLLAVAAFFSHFRTRVEQGVKRVGARLGAVRWPNAVRHLKSGLDRLHRLPGFTGFVFAVPLVLARALLFVFGWHEAVAIGATRIALSTFYTPLALVLLVRLVWNELAAPPAPHLVFRVAANAGAFILFAFGIVGLMVSDTGIALVTALGPLAFLHALSLRWRGAGPAWVRQLVFAFPLALFIALQARADIVLELGDGDATSYRAARLDANALRVIGQSDPQQLVGLGLRQSEALGVMYETMSRYATGPGLGYLRNEVSVELRATSVREHAVSALLAAQWGVVGPIALMLLLAAFALSAGRLLFHVPADRGVEPSALQGASWLMLITVVLLLLWLPLGLLPRPWGLAACILIPVGAIAAVAWRAHGDDHAPPILRDLPGIRRATAALFVLTFALSSAYMVLANYGWVAFTGKNVYMLGLDSISDIMESTALLGGAVWLAMLPPGRMPSSPGAP